MRNFLLDVATIRELFGYCPRKNLQKMEGELQIRYFGDSYDIVKQSLLRWLRIFGEWSVHPMFTEFVCKADVSAFESMLSAKVISTDVLTAYSDRGAYLECTAKCGHLFLDPDIGLRMKPVGGARAPRYLFADELLQVAEQRLNSLTAVFDQSLGRGCERTDLSQKLEALQERGVFGFAYISHACFIVASRDQSLIEEALVRVNVESRLPANRFISSFSR